MKQLDQVLEFHKKFKVNIEPKPIIPSEQRCTLRSTLLQEELNELIEAYKNKDIVEVADALADLQYVLLGTVIEFGLYDKFEEIFDEVHNSNMSKLDIKGNPIIRDDGKILKSDLYFPPNIKEILNK